MPDNVAITAGAGTPISTDEVTTLNGAAVAAVQVQRVKPVFGDDSIARDVSAAFPLPVTINDVTATGSLAAAAQTVALALNGDSAASIQLTGTWVGTVTFEGTTDGTTWVPVNALPSTSSVPATTATVNGLYRLTPGGLAQLRAHMTAFTSGSATVTARASEGTGGIFANQILPVIGSGVAGTAAAGVVTVQGIAGATAVPVSGTFFQATQPVSLATNTPDVTDRAARLLGVLSTGANTVGNVGVVAGTAAVGHLNELRASTLAVTATGVSAAAVTLTLPAVAGVFHYITSLEIRLYSTAARTGAAAPIVVTSTNLPGALAWTFDTAGAIGSSVVYQMLLTTPAKSTTVNTATTIVAPIATSGIWRINATYFTAA